MWAAIKGTIESSSVEFCLDEQKIAPQIYANI
jgi:hypothetical protein